MKLSINPIGSNQTEVHAADGTVVLFSYKTPVAACMGDGSGFIRTSTSYSRTTSKHINGWLDGAKAKTVEQSVLDSLV